MSKQPLLIELGTEELPPKSLKQLSAAFTKEVRQGLLDAQLIDGDSAVTPYASPRRLAVVIDQVAASQPDQTVERRGPAVQAAFKDGKPTPAALGFAKSCGVEIDQLNRLTTDKGEWLAYEVTETGRNLTEIIQDVLDSAIKRLPIPKRMRWGDYTSEFVRPLRWLIVMHNDSVLDVTVLGIAAHNISRGHRFHSTGDLRIESANDYASTLSEQGKVVASFDKRQAMIKEQIEALADSVNAKLSDDDALLDEVTGLVEFPRAVLGKFDESFLNVPKECLVSSMRDHQKYFHLLSDESQLLPYFITVSNIQSKDERRMIQGNERVLKARLADAEFFWQSDQKIKLAERADRLASVLFHAKLGTVADKSTRITKLAEQIAVKMEADAAVAARAATLAKADLVTDMVGEFDELQGIMGHYYADLDGEASLVGDCIEQHYWPKFAGDQLPETEEAQAVALADKLDSLVGIYAAGEIPTGDKDPYGLRRSALSILRILIEKQHPFSLAELVDLSANCYSTQQFEVSDETRTEIVNFIRGRLMAFYQGQGIATTTINAVLASTTTSPLDFEQRLKAVSEFSHLDDAEDLAAANKRIGNILKKQSHQDSQVDESLLQESAEKQLYQAIVTIEADCLALFDRGEYSNGLTQLASLRVPVDDFFDHVMVMSDNDNLQKNRLSLLTRVHSLFLRVADISLLQ